MRDVNGWMVAALGAVALVAAFFLGGRVNGSPGAAAAIAPPPVATTAGAMVPGGIEFGCAPGQRVVMREGTATTSPSATCVDPAFDPLTAAAVAPGAYAATPVSYAASPAFLPATGARPYARPAVITEPLEVYQPRTVSYQSVRRPVRTKTKSAVIIGSSAAVGATIGGLTKGKKGALIGGLLGGGAATVWDQVTRRQDGGR
jgi:hypothetical protein